MQNFIIRFFKIIRSIKNRILIPTDWVINYFIFYINGVKFSTFDNTGWPRVNVSRGGQCILGENFRANNRETANPIGRFNKCSFIIKKTGKLVIGDNVGMSSTAIVCQELIKIGNNVKIGGNVVIYDTDFHSLNAPDRLERCTDNNNTRRMPVIIEDNVFIGAHSTILKGARIGENSIIGACSVVTKEVGKNEIWAGNPAQFIRKI